MSATKEVRLALTKEEIRSLLSYVGVGTSGWEYRFDKLYNFLADLAQAPIYREGMQIDVTEPFAVPPQPDDVTREIKKAKSKKGGAA